MATDGIGSGRSPGSAITWRSMRVFRRIVHGGWQRRCTCCGASLRQFRPYGDPVRVNAECPVCWSLERHRLAWMYLAPRLRPGMRLLHLAPEEALVPRLRAILGAGHLTADLAQGADVRADFTHLPFRGGAFDVVYACHVLEHIVDDREALRETYRVLVPGGWAFLPVPIRGAITFENSDIATPAARREAFGQHDHVRYYGADFGERLAAAGFRVARLPYAWDPREEQRLGLRDEPLWIATR